MDHLRSSVGLRGYAQVDPKVEYKREGMRTFEQMWTAVGERVTDLVFRMEQLDENFVGSTWIEPAERFTHDRLSQQIAAQQQAAIEGTQATTSRSRSAIASSASAATIPAPAAAARSTRTVTCKETLKGD